MKSLVQPGRYVPGWSKNAFELGRRLEAARPLVIALAHHIHKEPQNGLDSCIDVQPSQPGIPRFGLNAERRDTSRF
jgi:hypothetical protein